MASSILNSDDGVVSGTSGLKSTGGDDGVLVFQSKGVETARINTDKQIVAAAGTNSLPALTTTGDLNTGIYFPAADTIAFTEGGVEAMRIDSSGNVGIGITPQSFAKLQVKTATNRNVTIFDNAAGPTVGGITDAGSSTSLRLAGENLIFTGGGGSGAEHMRIDTNGNVGIGTTSTSNNRLSIDSTASSIFRLGDFANARSMVFGSDAGGLYGEWNADTTTRSQIRFQTRDSGAGNYTSIAIDGGNKILAFVTNSTERARITSGGYFKASNNGSYSENATQPYHDVHQSDNERALVVGATNASYGSEAQQIRVTRNTTNNSFYALGYFNVGANAYKFRIADSGNVTNTNNSYGQISDIKTKQDIVDAASQWDDIKNIRVRKFRFKNNPTGPLQIGVVAQEAEVVSPGLIDEHPDKKEETRTREVEKTREVEVTPAVLDEDGNVVEPAVMETETYTEEEEYTETVDLGTTTKSVKYSVLYMKAVKALQEAMERIETLEAKVAALEGN